MENLQTPPAPVAAPAPKSYISLPPEQEPVSEPIFSAKFVIFAVLMIGGAAVGGLLQSGRISLKQAPGQSQPGVLAAMVQAVAKPAAVMAPHAPVAVAAPTPKPGTFAVTSISIGQPSFAIINGTSRVVGDPVEAPGVKGWTVRQILDGAVVLQNGAAMTLAPLTTPGLKPLDDELHPLN